MFLSSHRLWTDSEMRSWALRPSFHRLSAEQRQAEHGLHVQRQQGFCQGGLLGLQEVPLQHTGLQHQEGPHSQKQEALPEHSIPHAFQTYVPVLPAEPAWHAGKTNRSAQTFHKIFGLYHQKSCMLLNTQWHIERKAFCVYESNEYLSNKRK